MLDWELQKAFITEVFFARSVLINFVFPQQLNIHFFVEEKLVVLHLMEGPN